MRSQETSVTIKPAPVLITAFNRPIESRRLIDELRGCGIESLYVVIDGPRENRPGDSAAVAEVETMFREIDFVSEVNVFAREKNLGCGASPRDAIGKVFEKEEILIVLEDDCLPSKDFFSWSNTLLQEFAHDPRVGAICGYQIVPESIVSTEDFFWASNLFVSGAWATWRRVWQEYRAVIGSWRSQVSARRVFEASSYSIAGVRWLTSNWEWTNTRESDVWDHQMSFSLIRNRQLVLKPPVNLVENIGFNERGTHTHSPAIVIEAPPRIAGVPWDEMCPGKMRVNSAADRWIMKHDYQAQSTPAWLGDLANAAISRVVGRS